MALVWLHCCAAATGQRWLRVAAAGANAAAASHPASLLPACRCSTACKLVPSRLQALVAEMVGNFSKRLEPYGVKVRFQFASLLPADLA